MAYIDIQVVDGRWYKRFYDLEAFVIKCFGFSIPKRFSVIVHLVDDSMIKEINCYYRKKDRVTNVVSLSYLDEHNVSFDSLIGEVFISYDRVIYESMKYRIPLRFYFGYILIHSSLHVMRYDHVTPPQYIKMRCMERRVIKLLGIKINLAMDGL